MAYTTQYIGSRYVPLFAEPAEWDSARTYEPLTIVIHEGNSYTSRQYVPVGIEITNEKFWALTGNYNAQVEAYRRDVATLGEHVTTNTNDIAAINQRVGNIEVEYCKCYNNVADMQADSDLQNGMIVRTSGFYSAGDGGGACYSITASGTENGMDIIRLKNSLYAVIVPCKIINLECLGAQRETTNVAEMIERALDICDTVVINGTYHCSNCNINGNGKTISGIGKFHATLENNASDAAPMITMSGSNNRICNGEFINHSNTQHFIIMKNGSSQVIDNCWFYSDLADMANGYVDVQITFDPDYTHNRFLQVVKYNRFQKIALSVNRNTDGYILYNELWGNGLDRSLYLNRASCMLVAGNELIGGNTYGALVVTGDSVLVRIIDNYFDGGYDGIGESTYVQIADSNNKTGFIITNNFFLTMKRAAMEINNLKSSNISNNVFYKGNRNDGGYNDIVFYGTGNDGNVISGNTFYRESQTKKGSPIVFNHTDATAVPNIISSNNVNSASTYNSSILPSNAVLTGNNGLTQ